MSSNVFLDTSVVLAAGVMQGLFAVPMKYAKRWQYENIWLIFAVSGLVVFPWLLTLLTIPHIAEIYRATPEHTLVAVIGFGICWGTGATLTGLALNMLGIGLAMAIVLGLSASVGSLIPLLVLTPENLATEQGRLYVAGTAVMLLGIVLASYAGALRDRGTHLKTANLSENALGKKSFIAGLLVATFAGLFSSSLNFVYAFGSAALTEAQRAGVSPVWMSNVIAAPAVSGGFIANALYCGYLLRRNRTVANFFWRDTRINWFFGALMGALWFGGQALYGLGVYRMGAFGTVIGWPLLMGTIIVTSNFAGLFTGEWVGSERRALLYLGVGVTIILIALYVLSLARQA